MATQIRKLFDSDRSDIVDISRHIWDGHDYLQSVAEEWLKDANCHFYGVEVDGHVVAVGNLRLVDDGRTGWMEGLRVHPAHRGKGFAKEITRYLIREAEGLKVQRLRYTTSNENSASLKLAVMAGFSRLFEMAVFGRPNPERIPPVVGYPAIEEATPKRVYHLLETNQGIIPRGILIYDWKALDCTLGNLKEIGSTHKFRIALRTGKVSSLSFGILTQEPKQVWWSCTIFANSADWFMAQLSHNIATALELRSNMIACTFETKFEKCLKEVHWETGEHWKTHVVLLEKQMHA